MEEKQREVQWREGGKKRGDSGGKRVHLIDACAIDCARGEARVGGLGAIWRVHMWGALMVGG